MALKAIFNDIADVPEKFRELYSETSSGVWQITGIEGLKSEQEFLKLKNSMEQKIAEADKIRAACEKNGITPDEFETISGEFAGLKTKLAVRDSEFQKEQIRNSLRETALKMGVRAEALADVLARESVFTADADGTIRTDPENGGLRVAEWLEKQLKESPHWLNPSRSAGVRQNSFSHASPVRNSTMAEIIAESWNKHK